MLSIFLKLAMKPLQQLVKHCCVIRVWALATSKLWQVVFKPPLLRDCDTGSHARWENIWDRKRGKQSHLAWGANLCSYWSNSRFLLRTRSQWFTLALGHKSLTPSDGHFPTGGETLGLPRFADWTTHKHKAHICCQQRCLFFLFFCISAQ